MGRWRPLFWVFAPLAIALGTLPFWGAVWRNASLASVRSPRGIAVGERVPDIQLPTLSEQTVSPSTFAGKPWVLTFASCSCPHSTSTAKALKQVQRRFSRLPILAVYVREAHPNSQYPLAFTFRETEAAARSYQRLTKVTWPIALDTTSGRFHRAMGELPNGTYIIDRDGNVARSFSFMPPVYVFEEALKEVLQESAARPARLASASFR